MLNELAAENQYSINSHYDNNNISTAGRATALLKSVYCEDFKAICVIKYVIGLCDLAYESDLNGVSLFN